MRKEWAVKQPRTAASALTVLRRLVGVLAEGGVGADPFLTIGAANILSPVLRALVASGNPAMRTSPLPAGFHIAAERAGVGPDPS